MRRRCFCNIFRRLNLSSSMHMWRKVIKALNWMERQGVPERLTDHLNLPYISQGLARLFRYHWQGLVQGGFLSWKSLLSDHLLIDDFENMPSNAIRQTILLYRKLSREHDMLSYCSLFSTYHPYLMLIRFKSSFPILLIYNQMASEFSSLYYRNL